MKKKILFVVEAVTLSQVVRLRVLAAALDPRRFEIHFASATFDDLVFRGTRFRRWPIHSIAKERVDRALVSGRRLYERSTLERYVAEERRLIDAVRPDLVVGDFRLSLPVSTALASVPFAALINAYWSPHAVRSTLPMPDHPMVRLFGVDLAERYFPQAVPHVFAHFARPVNALRKNHGLSPVGSLQEVLTCGQHVLFPDEPSLVPIAPQPAHQRYLGPVTWSPDVALPEWWDRAGRDRPCIYVTLGSSGSVDVVPAVLSALSRFDVDVLLATAGRVPVRALPANVFAAEYLPGDLAAKRSALVVCNGGASTAYQALAAGVPVVGIPYNLDAYLAMTAIRDAGAGVLVRAGNCSEAAVSGAVRRALSEEPMRQAAREVAVRFARYDALARFRGFVDEVVGIGSTVVRRASIAVLAFLLSFSLLRRAAAHPGTGSTPASFEVVDEEKHAVALSSLRGRPVLIVFEDRDGTAQNEQLKTRIGLTVKAKGLAKKMSFLPIASVSAFASWPARGFVEKALTDAAKKAGTHVYADWTGDARTKLAAPAGKSTIVLLDGKGRAVWSTSGALDSLAQDRFLEVLVQCVAG